MSTLGIAIVTGAAQGIGRAISLQLADDGFDVAINDIQSNKPNLDAVGAEIAAKGRRTTLVVADVADEEQVRDMVDRVVRELGGLDVMIANAGICRVGTLMSTDLDNWDANFGVNVRAMFLCFKYAAKQMISQGRGGRLVGATSAAGKTGSLNKIAYSASKFAVRGLVQSAALELGRHGITVNSYAPGAIVTPLLDSVRLEEEHRSEDERVYGKDFYQTVSKRCAMGYVGQPEDVASAVSYLVSKRAHYITGQSFSVDGGVVFS